MDSSSHSNKPDPSKRKSITNPKRTAPRKPGVKKVFTHAEAGDGSGRHAVRVEDDQPGHIRLDLPPGPVMQIHSTRMRSLVDTFIKNTSKVHTSFRGLLQGRDGGFQGDMDGTVIAHIVDDKCLAALAIVPDKRWYIHDNDAKTLTKLLDGLPRSLGKPHMVEGESPVIYDAVKHNFFKEPGVSHIKECVHLELEEMKVPYGPGGHNRLAQESDLPRLGDYYDEYDKETGNRPPYNLEKMIAEKRVLLCVVEGAIAAVAIRGSQTLDRVLIDGVYTFKPYRRRGLSRRLITALARQGSSRGQVASVIVGKKNDGALALLDSLGFIPTAEYLVVTMKASHKK
ncbi:MAG: GNAT family N-acetyltransferase [bacterium]|nr:GNAT family N-acetyltransferase [bacterium]